MHITFGGRVQSGKNDASRWLNIFNHAYSHKLGTAIFPGSLNILLDQAFDWSATHFEPLLISFQKQEYGGERDIVLLPCILGELDRRKAWLWSTTDGAKQRPDLHLVEIICEVGLRETYGLRNGDLVRFQLSI
jgi:CTP-dependent riboflavin kinase